MTQFISQERLTLSKSTVSRLNTPNPHKRQTGKKEAKGANGDMNDGAVPTESCMGCETIIPLNCETGDCLVIY